MLPQYRLDTDLSKEAYAKNLSTIASDLSISQKAKNRDNVIRGSEKPVVGDPPVYLW